MALHLGQTPVPVITTPVTAVGRHPQVSHRSYVQLRRHLNATSLISPSNSTGREVYWGTTKYAGRHGISIFSHRHASLKAVIHQVLNVLYRRWYYQTLTARK